MKVFLGTLWSFVKQIKPPSLVDLEHRIALHAMQGTRASSLGEGEVSCFFLSCGWNLGYILELWRGWPFKIRVCSVTSGLLSSYDGHFRNLNKAWQEVRQETESHFLVGTVILGFLTILKNCQALSKYEAVNSTWLSSCQRHVRPIFEMKWRPRAFSRDSTGDSDILSSCDMNDEHA